MGSPVVELCGVSKRYRTDGADVLALRDVSFAIEAGAVVALIGPSGSGKSTLLNVVSGLDRPTDGEVRVCGKRLSDLDAEASADFRRRHIGFVFQFFNLIPTMSAADNVAVPLLAEGCTRRQIAERVERALSAVGLAAQGARRASRLSGGEMQRVAIARALVMDPPLVLADEPTGNLDSTTGEAILQLLCTGARAAGRAVLLVTHSYMAAAHADRTLVVRDGEIVDEVSSVDEPPARHLVRGVPSPPRRS